MKPPAATSCSPTSSSAAATPASRRSPSCRTSPRTRSRAIRALACTGCAGCWSRPATGSCPRSTPSWPTYALRELRGRGIDVRLGTTLEELRADSARLSTGETLPTRTAVWTAGVAPHPSLRQLCAAARRARARPGRRPSARPRAWTPSGRSATAPPHPTRAAASVRPPPSTRCARALSPPATSPPSLGSARRGLSSTAATPPSSTSAATRPWGRWAAARSAASPPGGWPGPTT